SEARSRTASGTQPPTCSARRSARPPWWRCARRRARCRQREPLPRASATASCARAQPGGEALERPVRTQPRPPVVAAVDERVVARDGIHGQARLDRVPAVVPLDQVVDLVEAPALDGRTPAPPEQLLVVAARAGELLVRIGQRLLERLREPLDLAQAQHVGQWAAERGEVALGARA